MCAKIHSPFKNTPSWQVVFNLYMGVTHTPLSRCIKPTIYLQLYMMHFFEFGIQQTKDISGHESMTFMYGCQGFQESFWRHPISYFTINFFPTCSYCTPTLTLLTYVKKSDNMFKRENKFLCYKIYSLGNVRRALTSFWCCHSPYQQSFHQYKKTWFLQI